MNPKIVQASTITNDNCYYLLPTSWQEKCRYYKTFFDVDWTDTCKDFLVDRCKYLNILCYIPLWFLHSCGIDCRVSMAVAVKLLWRRRRWGWMDQLRSKTRVREITERFKTFLVESFDHSGVVSYKTTTAGRCTKYSYLLTLLPP